MPISPASISEEVKDLGDRRLPLSADRRSQLRLSVRSEAARAGEGHRRGPGDACRTPTRSSSTHSIATRPKDMVVTMHLCRGNFQSAWVAEGGYEPVAEVLFNEIDVDGYFLEYDDPRSGDFKPLRFLPKGKTVVLGLVTTQACGAREQGRSEAPHRRGGAATRRSTSSRSRRNAASPARSKATRSRSTTR